MSATINEAAVVALPRDKDVSTALSAIPLVVLLDAIVMRRAWVMDDAYITFRTVDNFLHGYGLTWNTVERSQAFTNPLWMFLVSAGALITREVFYTSYVLQIMLTTMAGYVIFTRLAKSLEQRLLCAAVLCLSKAFVDFSTSGLENSLSHLLLALYAVSMFRETTPIRAAREQTLIASFALVNRLDLAIILAPPLIGAYIALLRDRSEPLRNKLVAVAWGASPFLAWEAFSLFYYGSFVANSARAKLASGIPAKAFLQRGFFYYCNSLRIDPVTLLVIGSAVVLGFVSKIPRLRLLSAGIAASLFYVAWVGGCHMTGRLFSVPLLMSTAILARLPVSGRTSLSVGAVFFIGAWAGNLPTFTRSYQSEEPDTDGNGVCDYARGVSVGGFLTRTYWAFGPRHEWIDAGKALRKHPEEVPVWGGIGLAGYYAGPKAQIVDKFALSDPLLARLPVPDATHDGSFRIGHYERRIPEGYVEGLALGLNRVKNPALYAYYEKLRLVTRGSLWDPSRWVAIVALNLGLYDHLLRDYMPEYNIKRIDAGVIPSTSDAEAEAKEDIQRYEWNAPSANRGVVFSEWGVRVALPQAISAKGVVLGGHAEDYRVTFKHDGAPVGTAEVHLPEQGTLEVALPDRATGATIDAVEIVPVRGKQLRRVHLFKVLS
jgi:arabinofuranosyltransferase